MKKKWTDNLNIGRNSKNELSPEKNTRPAKRYGKNQVEYLVRLSRYN